MKKVMLLLILTILVLSSCTAIPSKQDEMDALAPQSMGVITLESAFYQKFEENPIDAYYSLTSQTEPRAENIEENVNYYEAWEKEIQAVLTSLEQYLQEDDFLVLKKSSAAWTDYLESAFLLETSLYYPYGEYASNAGYPTANGMTYPLVTQVRAERIRQHAAELFSYLYAFTGEVTFVFDADAGE